MTIRASVIVYNNFDKVAKQLPKKVGQVVRKTAKWIETRAKVLCPVDTGFLRSSIQSEAQGLYRSAVNVGADYAAYVEFGTLGHPPQPYLNPAVDQAREFMQELLGAIRFEF